MRNFISAKGSYLGVQNMNKAINLQDVFLNQVRKEKIPVTVYLTNGFQFKGIVRGFDTYSIIVDSEGKQELIFKHAVSTIMPIKPVHILDDNTQNT
jgi:host factor-I protein